MGDNTIEGVKDIVGNCPKASFSTVRTQYQ
ncbi:hypothetical protein A2U01_0017777, partial [Trifolium medium]|nr:hypothetical protein [Trifolium medium]